MYISEFDKAEIRKVIERQLQALRQDDFATAFAFASPAIQEQFQSSNKFQQMVTENYSVVYRPRSVMFRGLTMIDNFPAQKLILMDAEGNLIEAVYVMQQQQDYSWRVHGCFLTPVDNTVK